MQQVSAMIRIPWTTWPKEISVKVAYETLIGRPHSVTEWRKAARLSLSITESNEGWVAIKVSGTSIELG